MVSSYVYSIAFVLSLAHHSLQSNLNSVSAQGFGAQGQPINLGPLFSQGPVEVNQATGRLAVVNVRLAYSLLRLRSS